MPGVGAIGEQVLLVHGTDTQVLYPKLFVFGEDAFFCRNKERLPAYGK
jgi:hypothetical protein